ncbi:MAG TPA: AMP-binding protein [Pseudonocardiaceae bacterium]|nr:AMP-binding protein [Pseudonocardiaceae bacterium]
MRLVHPDARIVVAATGETLLGGELTAVVDSLAERLARLPPGVLLARMPVTRQAILRYLAALRADRAVALLDPAQPYGALIDRFRPAAVLGADWLEVPPAGYLNITIDPAGEAWVRDSVDGVAPHPDLAVLLPTSGSTGNPRLVRLSADAISANAAAIADVLGIGPDDIAPTSLPLHFSYGLSVLNSHLLRGATVVIADAGLLARSFWSAVNEYGVTSLAGVPHHYRMLRRIGFDPARYPTLRTLTQAGGALEPELVTEFHTAMTRAGGRMFVMYGQTEAAPRMATLPSERLPAKPGSVGPALPGGGFAVSGGEIVYRGPNVMMGYATTAADVARGDDCHGVLHTGDLGHLDDEGYLYVTGRSARIGKVFGHRVSLDDLENLVRAPGRGVAAVAAGDRVALYVEGADAAVRAAAAQALAARLRVHVSGFDVQGIDSLPLLASGKVDYRALEARCGP